MPPSTPRLLLTLLATAPPAASLLLYIYLRTSPSSPAIWTLTSTAQHANSYAMTLLNPRRFATQSDSLTLRLPLRESGTLTHLSDEEVLARFTKGFFGGWAFTPERLLLGWTGLVTTKIPEATASLAAASLAAATSIPGNQPPPKIWSPASLSQHAVPPLGSLLFNNFYLLDSSSAAPARAALLPESLDCPRPSCAFAEFAFGSAASEFAGVHRFEVGREAAGGSGKGDDVLVVKLSHVRCNPTRDGAFVPAWLSLFHEVYAKVLFANGIREVMKA